jgi:hypothetical protein
VLLGATGLVAAGLAVCVLATPGLVFGSSKPAVAQQTGLAKGATVVTLEWGNGEGRVGLASTNEGLTRGPEAFAVADDGRIAVLDSVNKRVLVLKPTGEFESSVAIDLQEPRLLAVSKDRIYVLDCDASRKLVETSWDGSGTKTTALPKLNDVVTGLFATKAGPVVEVGHESSYLVASASTVSSAGALAPLSGRPLSGSAAHLAKASFKPGKAAKVALLTASKSGMKVAATDEVIPGIEKRHSIEYLVSVDGTSAGDLVVGAHLSKNTSKGAAIVVTRLRTTNLTKVATVSAGMQQVSELLLADCSYAYLGQPYVVSPDGRVIQPMADKAGYRLVAYTFGADQEVAQ